MSESRVTQVCVVILCVVIFLSAQPMVNIDDLSDNIAHPCTVLAMVMVRYSDIVRHKI